MKLIILGKHTKDKGNQLEQLTKLILESKGYKDINTNILSSGGEIDVTAYYEQPSFTEPIKNKVICECKALDDVVNITAWHKFIGKLHIELMSDSTTTGVMIAMSGVNGHVSGSYDDIKQKDNRINLITGDQLYDIVQKRYDILEIHTIQNYIFELTHRRVSSSVVLYYDNNVYWAVMFGDGLYSIVNKDGSLLSADQVGLLCPMLEQKDKYSNYLNIEDEKEFYKRNLLISKFVVDFILAENHLSISMFIEKFKLMEAEIGIKTVSQIEIEQSLCTNPFIENHNGDYSLIEITTDNVVDFLLFVLSECIIPTTIAHTTFGNLINESLMRKIISIQHNISIDDSEFEEYLFFLKHSPSALTYALVSDLRISRYKMISGMENALTAYTNMFKHTLMQHFLNDYHNQNLHPLYHDQWNISKLCSNSNITIFNEHGEAKTINTSNTFAILRCTNIPGEPLMLVSKFDEITSSLDS